MKVLDKMNEITGDEVEKGIITEWAYMNRICVCDIGYEEEFKDLRKTVDKFMYENDYIEMDEYDAWELFLDSEYVE